jgi:hypothetical protein
VGRLNVCYIDRLDAAIIVEIPTYAIILSIVAGVLDVLGVIGLLIEIFDDEVDRDRCRSLGEIAADSLHRAGMQKESTMKGARQYGGSARPRTH